MPAKNVLVEIRQGEGFKTECTAGKHTVVIDQPAALGGTDEGPTPLDYQCISLGGCIAAIGRIIAKQRRLPIRGIQVSVEGKLNTDRLLGKTSQDRTGFSSFSVVVAIDADLSREEKAKLLSEIDDRCPVSDNLTSPAAVAIVLAE
ncbi:MAG TPA: OsmC family protein [Phycisphaerae bacterium]|nr:OsmC family protein [Phycisphaerae bacterium]